MNKRKKYTRLVKISKKLLGIPINDGLNVFNFFKYQRLKYGPYIYKKKYNVKDVVDVMIHLGMKEGSNVFIHSSWNEFYNYLGTEYELIDEILRVIGPSGTLIMPAIPLIRKNRLFNVRKTVTKAGVLAEEFRKYPGVKRSINLQHSVCALGPQSDYLLNEHHLGDNCWDERSPYYKLSKINALVFCMGIHKRFVGTMVHCVEGVLFKEFAYFRDLFEDNKTEHKYIDYDGTEKNYCCYDLKAKLVYEYFSHRKYVDQYLDYKSRKLSNLIITMYQASQVIPTMIENGRRGIILYAYPSKRKYVFAKK